MRLAVLRTDPAWRTLKWLALGGVAIGALWAVSIRDMLADDEFTDTLSSSFRFALLLQVPILAWSTAFWFGARDRVDELRLALPVAARTWYGGRAAVMLLVGWLPLAGAAVGLVGAAWSTDLLPPLLESIGAASLGWAAWVALCFAHRPARMRLDSTPYLVAITIAGAAIVWAGILSPGVGAALSLAVLAPAAIVAWRGVPRLVEFDGGRTARRPTRTSPSLPASTHTPAPSPAVEMSLSSAPSALETTRAERAKTSNSYGRPLFATPQVDGATQVRKWIARRTWLKGRNSTIPVAAVVLILISRDGPFASLFLYAYVAYFAWLNMTSSTRVLREVGHLPVPRRRIARHVLLPTLLAFAVAGGSDVLLMRTLGHIGTHERVDLVSRAGAERTEGLVAEQRVQLPGGLTRVVFGSQPVVVTAPFGESVTLTPEPILPGLPLGVVNPYEIGADSSIDFVAWQLSRAVRDAYGLETSPDFLRDRYLSVLDGRVIGPFFGQELLELHSELRSVARPGRVGWLLAMLALFWAGAAWLATRDNVPRGHRARRRRRSLLAKAVPAVVGLVYLALLMLPSLWRRRLTPLEDAFAATSLELLGGHAWVLPVLAIALAACAYRGAVRRFERLEVPPPFQRTWYRTI